MVFSSLTDPLDSFRWTRPSGDARLWGKCCLLPVRRWTRPLRMSHCTGTQSTSLRTQTRRVARRWSRGRTCARAAVRWHRLIHCLWKRSMGGSSAWEGVCRRTMKPRTSPRHGVNTGILWCLDCGMYCEKVSSRRNTRSRLATIRACAHSPQHPEREVAHLYRASTVYTSLLGQRCGPALSVKACGVTG